MENEITVSIVNQIKEYLHIVDNDINPMDLHEKLWTYRNSQHPDRYPEPEERKTAQENFSNTTNLLKQLERYISQERLKVKDTQDLIVYESKYKLIEVKNELETAMEEIKSLKLDKEILDNEKQTLNKRLEEKYENSYKENLKELEKIYLKPMTSNALGLTAFFAGSIFCLNNIEKISAIIQTVLPFDKIYLNCISLVVFIITLNALLRIFLQTIMAKEFANKLCSPKSCKEHYYYLSFCNSWKDDEKYFVFSESDIEDIVKRNHKISKSRIKNYFLGYFMLDLNNSEVVNKLVNCVLAFLLTRRLIEISTADKLGRRFRIKTGASYYWDS